MRTHFDSDKSPYAIPSYTDSTDSTGFPVDGRMAELSADVREQLGLTKLPSTPPLA